NKSVYDFSDNELHIISEIQEKVARSNAYIYDVTKVFFETGNKKEKIPYYFSNVAAYKLDDNLINDADFEEMVENSPAGDPKTSSIINNRPVNLEQLKKINVNSDVLEDLRGLDSHSKSEVFFLEIIKHENKYILTIEKN
ncbi:hypothetical protein LL936_11445, partial [Levilactobacillus brevis]